MLDQMPRPAQDAAIRPFVIDVPDASAGRPPPAHQRDELAGAGDGHRCLAGRAARDDAGARALLGDRLRLAQGRGAARTPSRSS